MAIKTIAIVHHVHTDFGYTDHPDRVKLEFVKYINQAVDYVLASADYPEGSQFAWTHEQLYPLRLWWENATQRQKDRFFEAIAGGRMEVMGTAFNVTAFLDKNEWDCVLSWIPRALWDACNIKSIMQIDVNGMHTAGMVSAYDRGIRNLFMGPNAYYGAPPMPTPSAFNWQIAENKQMFVWLNPSYNNGTFLFNKNWRQGPVPGYSDLRYRAPERGDIWRSDEASILEAHRLCLKNVALIEGSREENTTAETDGFTTNRIFGGYALETLPVSVTNQWRVDNDPPFYPIVDFVKRWNEMGLQPRLLLCTATQAMDMVKSEPGDKIPAFSGQWIDWWANGNASSPVEMSFSREAKRVLKQAKSPLFGPLSTEQEKTTQTITEDICMYDEHTFGSWQSVSDPYSFDNLSQAAEKNCYIYRALDAAQCLLAERARSLCDGIKNKLVVFNPGKKEMSRFVELPLNCMRGNFHSVLCEESAELWPIEYIDGRANFLRPKDPSEFGPENVSRTFSDKCEKEGVRFGPISIPAMGVVHLVPLEKMTEEKVLPLKHYSLETDEKGWPVRLQFEGQSSPVIDGAFGKLISVHADGFSPRWTFKDIFDCDNEEERAALREKRLFETHAEYGDAEFSQSSGVLSFKQALIHDSLLYGVRILTVNLLNGRVDLELRINRRSDFAPEVLFLRFDAVSASENDLPWISNAGVKFRPEKDQLPGSCMDYYAIDGWIHYPNGWFLNSVDAALVTFGQTSVVSRKTSTLGSANRVFLRLFDNIWDTNFRANACGMMRFRFNIAADVPQTESATLAEAMATEPLVVVKMGYHE